MWLTKTEQIPEASDEDLRRAILTNDGQGEIFKQIVLEELLKRERVNDED
jgi:hypothetical protein